MTKKAINFEFTTNGNKVSLTFDKNTKNTANVSYKINYADGDETFDSFNINDEPENTNANPSERTARIFIALFDDLSFNADIETFDDVKDYIDGTYADEYAAVRQHMAEKMAQRMSIPFN